MVPSDDLQRIFGESARGGRGVRRGATNAPTPSLALVSAR